MSSCGFLYIATGKRFIGEAVDSVASLRKFMPNVETCCFTDEPELARAHFNRIELIQSPYKNFFEKIPPLSFTPFERTIFVDTDTIFTGDMGDVFDILERFEIAVVNDPFNCGPKGIPGCFSHMNTGLIAYQNTERVRSFFRDWFCDYSTEFESSTDKKNCHDQISFQRTLYRTDLRLYILPIEYNLRIVCPQIVRLWAQVRMIHARHPELLSLAERINRNGEVKVVWPNWSHFERTQLYMVGSFNECVLRVWHGFVRIVLRLVGV